MIIIYFLQEMDLLVLDPTVLTMVGRYRADVFGVPARGDNDAMRHYAYHQFVLWQHGKLGIGNRHVILSCHVCGKLDRHFQVKIDNTLGSKFID